MISKAASTAVPMLNAKMYPSHVQLSNSAGEFIKDLNYQNFVAELLKQVKTETSSGKKTRLPFGTIFTEFSVDSGIVVIYHPAKRHDYRLSSGDNKERTFNIPLPNMVSEVSLGRRDKTFHMSLVKVYCTNLEPGIIASRYARGFRYMGSDKKEGGVFAVPLTNMYDNGTICYGGNSLPTSIVEADLTPLSRPYEILTEAPGNHDLSIRGVRRSSAFSEVLSGSFVKFFTYWATLQEFPYDNMTEL